MSSDAEPQSTDQTPIRDSATLALLKTDSQGKVRILLGQRSNRHVFMPDIFVFPGGRVDEGDELPPAASELGSRCTHHLESQSLERPARAFPLAAIRETYEETGLLVGRKAPSPSQSVPVGWNDYFSAGAVPCMQSFKYVGRAITPPGRTRRFNSRFFVANADQVLLDDRAPQDSEELSNLGWYTLDEAFDLNIHFVTRIVLEHINRQLAGETSEPFDWDQF